MMALTPILVWLAAAGLAQDGADCLVVAGPNVSARELVGWLPEAADLPPDRILVAAPRPGLRRQISAEKLNLWLGRVAGSTSRFTTSGLCLEGAWRLLNKEEIVQAVSRVLQVSQEAVSVLDYSRYPVPPGELELPRETKPALHAMREKFVWRGRVRDAANRTVPVWALLRVVTTHPGIVARSVLFPGRTIQEADVELRDLPGWPDPKLPVARVESFLGRSPKRRIEPGTELRLEWFWAAKQVQRADRVQLEVQRGAVTLRREAVAESSGSLGEAIWVRLEGQSGSEKRVRARIVGPKKVVVEN
ncbi:MAG: flagellar basal body P-ring formation chaperone FlgA [Bryobacteraceae bacterium]|nr:flagellar basal body P-ring formation chaperone FlgA [Bryobacteraceae bacterium]MDW8380057.1 flagellar basal body P-ring formation chaperone FlgA [Bryobacterales bacterium]